MFSRSGKGKCQSLIRIHISSRYHVSITLNISLGRLSIKLLTMAGLNQNMAMNSDKQAQKAEGRGTDDILQLEGMSDNVDFVTSISHCTTLCNTSCIFPGNIFAKIDNLYIMHFPR